MRTNRIFCSLIALMVVFVFVTPGWAARSADPWASGHYRAGTHEKVEKLEVLNAWIYGTGYLFGENALEFRG